MKSAILVIVLLAFLNVDAAKKKKKAAKHELATTKHKITGPFRMPVFAIRMPIFGVQEMVRPSNLMLNDDVPKDKLKTVTKTSNSTKGPFKTYTVTSETKSTNESNPRIFEKIIKSVTTMNNMNGTDGKKVKFPNFRATRIRIFNPLKIFGGLGLPGFGNDEKEDDEVEKECSKTKLCKGEEFCDSFFGVCKKKVVPYGACTQKDQCAKPKGSSYECTWGRCVLGDAGIAGTFCDKQNDCRSNVANEDLGCFTQNDISRFSKVCVPKLGEGSTCGRTAGIFAMFEKQEDDTRCQGNLVCRAVGFFGRKACIKDVSRDEHKFIAAIKKHKPKTKHAKHAKH